MKRFRLFLLFAPAAFGCMLAGLATAQQSSPLPTLSDRATQVAEIGQQPKSQIDQLRSDINYLASDQLRGRGVGDETIDQASKYLAQRMEDIGLKIDSVDGTPFQPFNVVLGARPGNADANALTINQARDNSEQVNVSLGNGFMPLALGSSNAEVEGPLVFAGYGITAPKLDYDDYQQIDAEGAIVIILRKEPQTEDSNSRFQGTENTRHAFFMTKINNAIKHGASAVILVNDRGSISQSVKKVREQIEQETKRQQSIEEQIESLPREAENSRRKLKESAARTQDSIESLKEDLVKAERGVLGVSEAGRWPSGKPSIPVVSIARDLIDAWMQTYAGKRLQDIEKSIDDRGAPESFPFPDVTAALRMELQPLETETSNVIGYLPGKGSLADQSVVVGAHYDHVGMGGSGSLAPGTIAVHNGADDNASGTASLLSTAAQINARLKDQPSHRRVVLIAFTGEERGLLGSKHYVRNPRFPLDSTVAMVNLDMVGRLRDNELTVYGTGSADDFDAMVDRANAQQSEPFSLFKVTSGYGPSDHQSFYEAGIPVLFFFTGLHNDYHRPSDDSDKIDFGGLTRITDIVSDVVCELAIRDERPAYAKTENRVKIRRQLTAFLGVSLRNQDDHVVVSDLATGGPAERGGIQRGDRLESLGKQEIKTAADVIQWVRDRSPGDKAKAVVVRGGERMELPVELAKRSD